ncbi:hypothetical protein J6590_020869 [Homalodisca vitripennis]|nr:hypothetical protein J6590_020869 [Homalodisca vitripennis]
MWGRRLRPDDSDSTTTPTERLRPRERGSQAQRTYHPLAERSDSTPRFETGQHLFYKGLRRNTPDSCLQLPSLRFPLTTFEEGVQGIVRIRIPVLAFRTRDLPHPVKVETETTVPSEKLGKVEVYLSMLSFGPSPQITYEPKRPPSSTLRLPSSLPLIHCVRTGISTADSAIPIVDTLSFKSKKIDGNYPPISRTAGSETVR